MGRIVDATRTPIKKLAPKNPILSLLSHSMFAYSYQFYIYEESLVSAT